MEMMMLGLMLASLLVATPVSETNIQSQTPPVEDAEKAVRLEDVTVTGRSLSSLIERFVSEVAAPNPNRGLARWRDGVCVGVANLQADAAQYIVDRVSTAAEDVGLRAGEPGCRPNLLVIATDDASTFTRALVESRHRAFRLGGTGMDRGGSALREFQSTDHPVRWWQVSAPTDSATGDLAVRIPGQCKTPCEHSLQFVPNTNVFAASSVSTPIVDYITRTVVVIDVDEVGNIDSAQLADYIAMVSLAQIDPDADTSAYASILNIFSDPGGASSLTDWDKAYLDGLYSAQRTRKNLRAGRVEITSSIQQAHQSATTPDE